MLTELRIQDFAIIDQLDLDFDQGLVVFTGETGAGKSIIFDAVEVILGGRADSVFIRAGAEQAILEGAFRIPDIVRDHVHEILRKEDLLESEDFITLGREIRATGRNIARVNGRSVNVSILKELGELLVDLHGQSEHLSLLRTREHLGLLDRYANLQPELRAYQSTYHELRAVRQKITDLRQMEANAARQQDILAYQISEIENANLKPAEDHELSAERTRLANAENLAETAQEALQALDDGSPETPSASDQLGKVVHALNSLTRIDTEQSPMADQAQNIFEAMNDLARDLRDYLDNVEYNPRRLDYVEERLDMIQHLKRKYGATIDDVLAYAQKAHEELEAITQASDLLIDLQKEETILLQKLANQGLILSVKRKESSQVLAEAVQRELADLRMEGAQFQVSFERRPDPDGLPVENGEKLAFDVNGIEHVEFLIAPNPGEGFKPLVKIASGGETSRLMLALKNVLARADSVPTLIFDEIDQGIGGRVGVIVGQKLYLLSRQHQVLCITHLPQLAAYGDQHIHVEKLVEEGRTTTQVDLLSGEKRVVELAHMFGEVSEGTLRSAREILQSARKTAVP